MAPAPALAAPQGPAVERIEPAAGPPGTVVNIVGRRFGRAARVWIGGLPAQVLETLPSRVTVKVPALAKTGIVSVAAGELVGRGPEFRVTPPPRAAKITGIKPRRGPAGSEVVISGENFSPRMTGNLVELGGVPVLVRAASPVALTVIVPEGVTKARFSVRVPPAAAVDSATDFEVTAVTKIVDISPRRAGPGAELFVSGTGFSKKASDNRVYLSNRKLQVVSASAKRLKVRLPLQPASGRILVDVKGAGRAESGREFIVQRQPKIEGLTPEGAPPGGYVVVRGVHFGDDPEAVEAKLGDRAMKVIETRDNELVVEVPPLPAGTSRRGKAARAPLSAKLSITVHGVGPVVSERELVVLAPLTLRRFKPTQGPVGSLVNLVGTGFDAAPEQNLVTIAGNRAQVVSAGPGRLRVRVPETGSGPIRLAVAGQVVETRAPFVVNRPPVVTGVTPAAAEPGARVTVHGSGFGTRPSLLRAKVGNVRARVVSAKDDLLVVAVPADAKTGRLSVTKPLHGRAVSPQSVTIVERLFISALRSSRVQAGALLTIRGGGFIPGQTPGEWGGARAVPQSVASDRLSVRV
ncbi:MAG: IPT/TIG domain-containing protein, partial [Myxococcales bacterium]|nr:IPT/TIG domain-containing protein [Myxococcales bacterium]